MEVLKIQHMNLMEKLWIKRKSKDGGLIRCCSWIPKVIINSSKFVFLKETISWSILEWKKLSNALIEFKQPMIWLKKEKLTTKKQDSKNSHPIIQKKLKKLKFKPLLNNKYKFLLLLLLFPHQFQFNKILLLKLLVNLPLKQKKTKKWDNCKKKWINFKFKNKKNLRNKKRFKNKQLNKMWLNKTLKYNNQIVMKINWKMKLMTSKKN